MRETNETSSSRIPQLLLPLDRLFNRVFRSEYNPLYRSGTIAVALISIAMLSGLILLFFYRIGAPYESLVAIQEQKFLASWIRGVHRYASDAAVIAVVFHILRMAIQGKSWGPRAFAWMTGVGLMLMLFLSGWTGYVLIWDQQSKLFAQAGAAIFDAIGIFGEPISRSFDGAETQPPASFFFMNLFLHIVIPLAMIFGLWVHTSRMARATWMPPRRIVAGILFALIVVGIAFPAPLFEKADLLRAGDRVGVDWFFGFWLPWADRPGLVLAFWILGVLLLVSAPFWTRPWRDQRPLPAFNDPKACVGCRQCVKDCPYEAIRMVPRTEGGGSPEVALVDPDLCVSCGLCGGSCDSFTMGPPGRKAPDQLAEVRAFLTSRSAQMRRDEHEELVVIGCRNELSVLSRVQGFAFEKGMAFYPVDCAGSLHASVFDQLASRFRTVAVAACPERNCSRKDGFMLLTERISGERKPTPSRKLDRARLPVFQVGPGEEKEFFQELITLREKGRRSERRRHHVRSALALAGGVFLALGIAGASRLTAGSSPESAVLRLSWRLPGQIARSCVDRSEAELAALPVHMRTPRLCTETPLSYRLAIRIDGMGLPEEQVSPSGLSGDRPLYVRREIPIEPGAQRLEITFVPADPAAQAARFSLNRIIDAREGGVVLVHLLPDLSDFAVQEGGAP